MPHNDAGENSLRKANVVSLYNSIIKKRQSSFKCSFSESGQSNVYYEKGKCSNSAGYVWDPLGVEEAGD